MNAVADCPGRWIRAKIIGLAVGIAPEKAQTRKVAAREENVGVGFVVAKQDVVARRQRFDQVVFKKQCFSFGAGCRGFDMGNLTDHMRYARTGKVVAEVGADALFQVLGFADVKQRTRRVEHAVNARQLGQCRQKGFGIKGHGNTVLLDDLADTGEDGFKALPAQTAGAPVVAAAVIAVD